MNATKYRAWCRLFAIALLAWPVTVVPSPGQSPSIPASIAPPASAQYDDGGAVQSNDIRRLRFEENAGQTDPQVRFMARGRGYTLFLTGTDAVFAMREPGAGASAKPTDGIDRQTEPIDGRVIRMRMLGAHPEPELVPGAELPGVSHYYLGDDPAQWRTGVRSFDSVRIAGAYQGVDVVYYDRDGSLEYDFVLAAGADPSEIELAFEGADEVTVSGDGSLLVRAGPCELSQVPPSAYQLRGEVRESVVGRYAVTSEGAVRFNLGEYDRTRPLVIDPAVSYSTYLGGTLEDQPSDIEVDAYGNAFVSGWTVSPDFPRVGSPWTFRGNFDACIAVLGPAGMQLLYSAFLGGTEDDECYSMALDAQGSPYMTGFTMSANFPTVHPIETDAGNAMTDLFVAKLASNGASLVYSTYLGGNDEEWGNGIDVDPAGNAYVAGLTRSTDYPVLGAFMGDRGGTDAFVTKINATGTAISYSTYLGDSGTDIADDMAVSGGGEVTVVGRTDSAGFPLDDPFQDTFEGVFDCFVTRLSGSGSTLRFSTFIGGNHLEQPRGVCLDSEGAAIVAGVTDSSNFPTRNPIQTDPGDSNGDAFVLKLAMSGSELQFSTYLGGAWTDAADSVAVGADGRIYVAGYTSSLDFPTLNPVSVDTDENYYDGFLSCLGPTGSSLVYSTYFGGELDDLIEAVAVDGSGNAYVAGYTVSEHLPLVNPYQGVPRGDSELFVTKIRNGSADVQLTLTASPEPVASGHVLTYIFTVGNLGPNAAGEVVAALGVPAGTRYLTATTLQGHYVPPTAVGAGYYYPGRIPAGTAAMLRLDVLVEAAGGTTIENAGAVTTTAYDPVATNNTVAVTTHVASGVVPPDITNATGLVVAGKPYRIRLDGTNFQTGLSVYIGTDPTPWPSVKYKSATRLILKGSALKSRFPRGQMVQIRVVNPDTGSDTIQFTR
jgi:uncharacterized repeat protein (TIGR01451 family)